MVNKEEIWLNNQVRKIKNGSIWDYIIPILAISLFIYALIVGI
jgi:hypothetical protein